MTALSDKADGLVRALTPLVRDILIEQVRELALAERKAKQFEIDQEIHAASAAVARAYDRLASARFSGAPEANAHRALVKAAEDLGRVMRKHGRMPEGQ